MPNEDRLLAWIERRDGDEVDAAFVASATKSRRAPATQNCSSMGEARRWVEGEAAAVGASVEWVARPERD
jgi:hypothetical protein